MIVFLIMIVEILFCFAFKSAIVNTEYVSMILIGINLIIAYFFILTNKKMNKTYKVIIIISLTIRIAMVFVDQYVYSLPNSDKHGDAGGYNRTALEISDDLELLKLGNKEIYGGLYSKIVGILYFLTGNQRLFVQSINCYLGIFSVIYVGKVLNMLTNIDEKTKKIIFCVTAFFPQGIMLSAILHREALIALLITLSMYFCIKSLYTNNVIEKILSCVLVLIASMFHAGVIVLIAGYILIYSFFNMKYKIVSKSITRKFIFLILCGALFFGYIKFGDVIAGKLTNLDSETLVNTMERSRGGSAYLTNIKITGINSMILYSIPKAIYFMFSPMPWNWRSVTDAMTFVSDSCIYLYFIYNILKLFFKMRKKENMKKYMLFLLVGIFGTIITFGIGTYTAGAAMRHRHKLFYIIVITYSLLLNYKKKEDDKNEKNSNIKYVD